MKICRKVDELRGAKDFYVMSIINQKNTPRCQGDFDMLCGIYSIINGIDLVTDRKCVRWIMRPRTLFKRSLDFLDERGCDNITACGLDSEDWHALAHHLFGLIADKGMMRLSRGKTALRELPDRSEDAAGEIDKAVSGGVPVAIYVAKPWDHYTVVSHIDGDKWTLFDSYGYKSIKRASVGREGSDKRYILGEKAIFFQPR